MRFIVFGAGAIGGVVGGLLSLSGSDVVFIARGAHRDAIARGGLKLRSGGGDRIVTAPVVGDVSELPFREDDVVLLCVKSQDTPDALAALRRVAPAETPIVCLQNGVVNERTALRLFPNVYGVRVALPAEHLEPGVVVALSWPIFGVLEIGRFPHGRDATTKTLATSLRRARFDVVERDQVMRWKYRKLITNAANAVEAACGTTARRGALAELIRAEAVLCLDAAGIDYASEDEDAERRGKTIQLAPIEGHDRGGGSTWQSLQRNAGSVETDALNGEFVLLGRLHGVPTPANALIQQTVIGMAATGAPPGSVSEDDLLAALGHA